MKFRFLAIILLLGGQSCNKQIKDQAAGGFALSKTLSESKELVTAESQVVENEIVLTGKVTFNENMVARVFPLVGGFVSELNAEIGDLVKKGQVLALIRSPEIAGFIQDGLEAESRLGIAEKNAAVVEELFKSGQASEIQLINARRELDRAKSEVHLSKEILELYGAGSRSTYPIKAPSSGYVIQKNIALNMELRTEDISPVFIVGSLNEVWVMANVYESDISKIQVGQEADIITISYPDKVYKGKIDKIFNTIDAASRVLKARITLQNPDIELKPEMFARVIVRYKGNESKVVIPSRAIIFDKNKHFVMVYKADNDIETREVEIYKEHDGLAYIERGITPGEKIMTKYQLLVYDALND